jgi:hypothetical protein
MMGQTMGFGQFEAFGIKVHIADFSLLTGLMILRFISQKV